MTSLHPGNNDTIFLYAGSYTGGLTLRNGQQLIGQGASSGTTLAAIAGVTLQAYSDALPTLNGDPTTVTITTSVASTNAVTIGSGNSNLLRGFSIGNKTGSGIAGSGFGTLTVSEVNVSGTGQALNLNTGTVSATFGTLSSSSGVDGVSLVSLAGTLSATSGTLTGSSAQEFLVNGGAGSITYPGTVANTGTDYAVDIVSKIGGTVALSGPVSDSTGKGVLLNSNTGATINFSGGVSLSTGANPAFTATGGGTFSATQNNTSIVNTLTTTTGTALDVASTTIGASGLTFRSISANGGTNGIVLNTTGSSGGLVVTGDAGSSNNSSGGTLQNITTSAIQLTSTQNVSLDQMNIHSITRSGINGTGVTNFSFTNGTVNSAGTQNFDADIAFNTTNFSGAQTQTGKNISGTLTVTGSTLTNGFAAGLDVQSDAGTVTNANVSNNTLTIPTSSTSAISLVGTGNASTSFSLNNATINQNNITNTGAAGIQVSISNANASGPGATEGIPGDPSNIISITNNSVLVAPGGTHAIVVANEGANSASRTRTNFLIQCNGKNTGGCTSPTGTALGSSSLGTVILIGNNGYADMTGTVNNNAIVATHTPNLGGGNGIAGGNGVAGAGNAWTPDLTLLVTNNTISGTDGNGILLVGRGTSAGTLSGPSAKIKIASNNVSAPVNAGGTSREGIRVDAGNANSADDAVCLNIASNTSAGSNGAAGIGVRKQGTVATTNDFGIQTVPQVSPTNAEVQSYINAQNPAGGGTDIISGSNFVQCSIPAIASSVTPAKTFTKGTASMNLSSRQVAWVKSNTALASSALLSGSQDTGAVSGSQRGPQYADVHPTRGRSSSHSGHGMHIRPHTVTVNSNQITVTMGGASNTLPAGHSVTITFDVTVNSPPYTPANTTSVSNKATVTGTLGSVFSIDSNTVVTPLSLQADLEVTKTDDQSPNAVPGTAITYTIVATNTGPNDSLGTTITDTFPSSLTSISYTATATGGATGFTASGTGNINDTAVDMPNGSTVTYTVHATIKSSATGSLANTATITPPSNVTDPGTNDNTVTVTDTLTPKADLKITKTDDQHPNATPGTAITYTIVVTNTGPSDVTGATVADTFPASLTSVTWTAVGDTGTSGFTANGSGNINDTVNMVTGSTITYTVHATISSTATGTLSNTATVTAPSGTTDPDTTNNSATVSDTIPPAADLQITKTDDQHPNAVPGSLITYTIVVTNAGPTAVTGATVKDTFPSSLGGVTYTATQTGGASGFTTPGTGNINDSVTLPNGSTITYTVKGTITSSATGQLVNTATVTAPFPSVYDPNTSNNTATDTDTLTPQADLQITKTDNQHPNAVPGTAITYTIVVGNPGPSDVTGATVADTFPGSLTGISWSTVVTGGANVSTSSGTGNISDTGVNMPSGSTVTYTVHATITSSATGNLVNTATVTAPSGTTDTNLNNNTATDTDTLTPQADLQITKTDGTTTAVPGTSTTYTIVVTNAGPSDATGASVADSFSAAFSGDTYTSTITGGATGNTASGSGDISDTVTMPSGSTITYTVHATIKSSATGNLVNTATVTAPNGVTDTNTGNNTATDTDTLTPHVDLSITKTDGTTTAVPGTQTIYTIVVSNAGPSDAVNASVADAFSAAFSGDTYTSTTTGGATGNTSSGSGNISDTVTMPSGSTITYTVTASITSSATGNLVNTATVTAPNGTTDTNTNNNTATDTDTLTPQVDLQITKTDNTTTAVPGTSTTYTIVVSNTGPSDVSGAVVHDAVPTGVSSMSFTAIQSGGATGFTSSGTGTINDTVTMPSGSSITYTLTASIMSSATGNLVNTATVTAPNGVTDTNLSNNSATDTDTLTPQADLQITKTDNQNHTAIPGSQIIYTITVTNAGPSDVTGATVTDTFPASLTGVSYTAGQTGGASGFTASGTGNINDTSVNMPSGSIITYTATAAIPSNLAGSSISNTATVTAPNGVTDTNPSNNSATDVDQLGYAICLLYNPNVPLGHDSRGTVTISLQLCDSSKHNLSASTITVHATNVDGNAGLLAASAGLNTGNNFSYSATLGGAGGGYAFKFQPPSGGSRGFTGHHTLNFTVNGSSLPAYHADFTLP